MPIPMAEWFKACVCGWLLARMAREKPKEGMDVCVS